MRHIRALIFLGPLVCFDWFAPLFAPTQTARQQQQTKRKPASAAELAFGIAVAEET